MSFMGTTIRITAERMLGLAEVLAADVDAKIFARQPMADGKRVVTNHPAFVYGHLAIYPARVLGLAGKDASTVTPPAAWNDLFKAGAECRDDAEGTIYPGKDELVKSMLEWHRAALVVVEAMTEEEFKAPNPAGGRFSEIMPTMGAATMFLFGGHAMMHLGQVSAWRRVMGLPSAMR